VVPDITWCPSVCIGALLLPSLQGQPPAGQAHAACDNSLVLGDLEALDDVAGDLFGGKAQLDEGFGDGLPRELVDDFLQLLDRGGEGL